MRVEDFNNLDRVVDEENDWRHRPDNAYKEGDKAQVSIVSTENRDLKAAVKMAVDAIGGVRRALAPSDRVLLKPNFNSDDPYPASTDLGFLKAVVEILREEGINDLTLGERAGWPAIYCGLGHTFWTWGRSRLSSMGLTTGNISWIF